MNFFSLPHHRGVNIQHAPAREWAIVLIVVSPQHDTTAKRQERPRSGSVQWLACQLSGVGLFCPRATGYLSVRPRYTTSALSGEASVFGLTIEYSPRPVKEAC